jgi:hypothetical protein
MAQLIIVNKEQLAASLARFEKILADDAAEQERLRQLQKDAQAAPKPVPPPPSSEEKKP